VDHPGEILSVLLEYSYVMASYHPDYNGDGDEDFSKWCRKHIKPIRE